MLNLSGKKPGCLWCGEAGTGKAKYKEIIMAGYRGKAFVCSGECERHLSNARKFIKKSIPFLSIGVVLGFFFLISGIFAFVIGKIILPVSFIGVLILGITFINKRCRIRRSVLYRFLNLKNKEEWT